MGDLETNPKVYGTKDTQEKAGGANKKTNVRTRIFTKKHYYLFSQATSVCNLINIFFSKE